MDSTMVDNALDFVCRAALELWDKTLSKEQQSKYSTLHLYEAIELILNARLLRVHWSLILLNPANFDETPSQSGDFRSIGYHLAIDRLTKLCGAPLTKSQATAFNELHKLRNRCLHFPCTESRASLVGLQLRASYELLSMIEDTFFDSLTPHQKTQIKSAKHLMTVSEVFLQNRFEAIRPNLNKLLSQGTVVARCPTCQLEALVVTQAKCWVCETGDNSTEIAKL